MHVIKTKTRKILAQVTDEDLAKVFGITMRYIATADKCIELCDKWETLVESDEDGLTENLREFVTLPVPDQLARMIEMSVFYGEVSTRMYLSFINVLNSITAVEGELLGIHIPLEGEDGEYDTYKEKLVKVSGLMSVIAMNIIRGSEIVSSNEKGDLAVPLCLDIYLSTRGAYSDKSILTLVETLNKNIDRAEIVFELFDGHETLKDEFYGMLTEELTPIFEYFEEYLDLKDVRAFVDGTISEGELLTTLGLEEKDFDN